MSMMAVSEAAERLGVSTRQVQHLAARGDVQQIVRGFVDARSVDRLVAVRRGSRTRAWSEATAWGAIALLSGVEATWMGESQRSRLRGRLRRMNVDDLVSQARNRADVRTYAGHPSAASRVRAATISTHLAARRLGLADAASVDSYVMADEVDEIVSDFGLMPDTVGSFTLRVTGMDRELVSALAADGVVLAAVDLAESLDVRERDAGTRALEAALESFRG